MHDETTNTRNRRPWKSRAAALGGAVAAVLMLGATSAHADDIWHYWGTKRATTAEAQADLPGLKAQCRKDGGIVVNSGVFPTVGEIDKQAFVACRSLRATPR